MMTARRSPEGVARTTSLKQVALTLPQGSIARERIMRLPDTMPMAKYLEQAETLATLVFVEIEMLNRAKTPLGRTLDVIANTAKPAAEVA